MEIMNIKRGFVSTEAKLKLLGKGHRESRRGGGQEPSPGKSQVAIGFLKNTATDPLQTQLDPMGQNVPRVRFVRSSVKYVGY